MTPVVLGNAPQPPAGDAFLQWVLASLKQIEANSRRNLVNDTSSSGAALGTIQNASAGQFPYFIDETHVGLASSPQLLAGYVTGVNLNPGAATDTAITLTVPSGNYVPLVVHVKNTGPTASITTATAGVFSATGGGGTTIAAVQSLSALTSGTVNTAGNVMSMTLTAAGSSWLNFTTLQFRVAVVQGATATASVYVFVRPLP